MKEFGIFKKAVDTNLNSYFKKDSNGNLVYGDYYLIIPSYWYSVNSNNEFDFRGTGDDNEQLPQWLVDLVESTCPTCERGYYDEADDEFWISENEIEDLKKLASDYGEFIDENYTLKPRLVKHWFDMTNLYNNTHSIKANKVDKRVLPFLCEKLNKIYDCFKELSTEKNCIISSYEEPSTKNKFICIEAPEDFPIKTKIGDPEVEVSDKDLQRIPLSTIICRFITGNGFENYYYDKILISMRDSLRKELQWAKEFINY